MRLRLTADYRGVLTDEAYYRAGEYTAGQDMPTTHAKALISAGRAVVTEADADEPKRGRARSER